MTDEQIKAQSRNEQTNKPTIVHKNLPTDRKKKTQTTEMTRNMTKWNL